MIPVHYKRCSCAVWPIVMGNDWGICHRCGEHPDVDATKAEYEEDREQWKRG